MFISAVQFNIRVYGEGLSFGASLMWSLEELQLFLSTGFICEQNSG